MEMNGKTIKIVLGSFLVMTSVSMGLVTCEQWSSKVCLVFLAHTFLKHIFSISKSMFDPRLILNWKEIREDFAWKGVVLLMVVTGVKIKLLGVPLLTAVADILTELCLILVALCMVRYCRLHRNHCQDIRLMEKRSLASDSARTTFSFLENIIKGKKETMKRPSTDNFEKILEKHFEKEKIKALPHPKLVMLFPEGRKGQGNGHALGSVEDILRKEKEEGSEHTLTRENISYEYYAPAGRHRTAQLEVLKFRNKDDLIYMAISENRLLRSFYEMLSSPCVDFRYICSSESCSVDIPRWENFQMQFHIYRRELARLLDEDEGCRGR